jgi:hypothetical protein
MKFILSILLLLPLLSCDKKLDSIFVDDENIRLEYYRISRISTIHDYIDLTLKSSEEELNIYEANAYQIDSLYIRNDTIFIDKISKDSTLYNFIDSKFGYKLNIKYLKN